MSTYATRLETFLPHWNSNITSSRQLAAMGHTCDRPPLESLEDGSRCIECSRFVPKATSIAILEGTMVDLTNGRLSLHHPKCTHLQLRFPFEALKPDIGRYDFAKVRDRWERKAAPPVSDSPQTSGLFTLPAELRLQIYSYIVPPSSPVTGKMVQLNRDSNRMITERGLHRPGHRDLTLSRLLSTCKAIHAEALDLLFRNVTYSFASSRDLYLFLRQIGSSGRHLLCSVDVACGQRCDAISFALLASCKKLSTLTLRFDRPRLIGD
nr:hypothetical protein B0A51_13982 [Rachicladosporium sp. CCFEE 5018]